MSPVDMLAAAGFKNVYTVIDGFEGDKGKDPDSVFDGKRMRNGWKNSAPWVYDIDPEKIILEEYASKQTNSGGQRARLASIQEAMTMTRTATRCAIYCFS